MKYNRIAVFLLFLLVASFCVSSCSTPESNVNTNGESSLKVYMYKNDMIFDRIVGEFEYNYPKVKVDIVAFDDIGKLRQRFSSEVSAGEGPDIVYFDSYLISNLHNLLKAGAFCDLQQFFDKDESFDIKNYNKKVLDCGLYNGKRMFVPINYHIPVFFTTKELLKKINIDLTTGDYSQKSFFSKIDPYVSKIKNEKDKYIFSQPMDIGDYIAGSGLDFVDHEKKEVYFDKPEFIELMKNLKLINKLCPTTDVMQKYRNQEYDMLKSGDILFINNLSLFNPNNFILYNSFTKHLFNQTPEVFPMPTYTGDNKLVAIADKCMAINSNSKNKQQAYNFLMIALSEKIQSDDLLFNLPVNNEVLNKLIEKAKERESEEAAMNGIKFIMEPLPEGLAKDYLGIINKVDRCEFVDSNVIDFMFNSLQPYFEDKSSIENSINEMKNKIKVYLNE